ncbi:MAG: metallophosphoesterase [Polyangiaceae bacterium]|nr:metallophosphoesterase [Polyangiaceae bacterium]NUQ72083.1 metallophosphoesterase [Polyangiaceae bacterium]
MRTSSSSCVVLFGALFTVLAGCSTDPETPSNAPDAGAEPDAGLVCPETGITKGPWVLAVDGSRAKVRWEACKAGTKAAISLSEEAGGEATEVASVETPFEVTVMGTAPLNVNAPPDYPGTYYMHEASPSGLKPGTCYRYELSAEPARKGRFCTAQPPGGPVRFMAIGDTNPALGGHTQKILSQVLPKGPDFTIHGGDIQYYDSTLETWAYWFPELQPMLSQGAFFPAIGNHESELVGEFEQYYLRFFGGAGFDGTNDYYRFETGGIYFFSLNTELPLDLGTVQGTWLSAQLDAASKKPGFRFSVVYLHKTLVTCGDTGQATAVREQFEPLFTQYKVPLVVQAHMHGYERFEINGITYVTSAGGGGSIGNVDENIERPECAMRVASGKYRHAMLFEVGPGELKGSAIGPDGAVVDSFTKAVP